LRHDAVIGCNDEHDDICNFCAAGTHAGEGFVARCVNENNFAYVNLHGIRADMLGDSSGFAAGHIGFANRVEQTCLAMIHVAHHGYDRRTRHKIFRLFSFSDVENRFFFKGDDADDAVKSFGKSCSCWSVERLIDAGENSLVQQNFQKIFRTHVQLFRQLADGDAFCDGDFAPRTFDRRRSFGTRRARSADSGPCANGMKFAFAFFKAAIHCGPRARSRLAFINWFAGFGFADWRSSAGAGWALAGTHWRTTAGASWRCAGARRISAGNCAGRAGT
jgi:hypothetical protein